MYAQCDPNGNEYVLLDELIDVKRTDDALTLDQQKITVHGTTRQRNSTKGWFICCKWKDGSTSWEKLSDLKESHPVQVAEFAIQMGIALELGFNWWVFCVLKKRDAIILLVKQCQVKYLKKTHKYSHPLLKLVDNALSIDRRSGSTLWADAIAKEKKNVRVAFNALEDGRNVPHGFQFVKCHMIFDIKMEDFCCKACPVADGHMTNVPATYTCVSVVTCETVHIALMLAALNLLEVMMADIMNTYITALCKEKL